MSVIRLIKRKVLKSKIQKRHQLKREIQKKHGIYFFDKDEYEVLYSINNEHASEYNYLLKYILSKQNILHSGTTIDEFNFKRLSKNYSMIRELIQEELSRDNLQEQLRFKISRETAVSNMKNLQSILYSITKFQHEFDEIK
jgi:Trp operon repressor